MVLLSFGIHNFFIDCVWIKMWTLLPSYIVIVISIIIINTSNNSIIITVMTAINTYLCNIMCSTLTKV